jgi:hypothetical protein
MARDGGYDTWNMERSGLWHAGTIYGGSWIPPAVTAARPKSNEKTTMNATHLMLVH